jgi:hypothetical protein
MCVTSNQYSDTVSNMVKHKIEKLLFKVNTILELIFSVIEYFIKHLISNTKGLQLWNYFGKYAM